MRYYYIDILKIVSAFCVVFLHATGIGLHRTEQSDWWIFVICNSLTRFAVPLFVLCSGAMLLLPDNNRRATISLLLSRLKKVGIPLLFWSFAYEYYLILNGADKTIVVVIQNILSGNVMYHLWFLYMLISLYVISPILYRVNVSVGKYFLSIWIVFLSICLVRDLFQVAITSCFFYFSPYICYFFMGSYIHRQSAGAGDVIIIKKSRFRWMISLLFVCIFVIIIGTIKMSNGTINEYFFANDNLFVVIGSLIIFYVCRLKEYYFKKYCNRWIPYCSRLTFGVYLIHVYVLTKAYYSFLGGDFYSVEYPILAALVLSVFVFFISMVLTALLKKIPGLRSVV